MLTVHHLNNSRSQRILWLCEELAIDYAIVKHTRDPETQRSPDTLNAVHPLGKAPAVEHDGRVLVESEAIIEYICNRLAGGRLSRAPDAGDYGEYLQWLAFTEGTLFPGLIVDLIYNWTGGGNDVLMEFFDAEISRNHQYLDETLEGREYLLASGFSAADVNLGWALEFGECRGRLGPYANLLDYLARLRARPAYGRALEKGGPQDLSVFSAGAA